MQPFLSGRPFVQTRLEFQPRVNEQQAIRFLQETYGLDAQVASLDSERDQNFHVRPVQGKTSWVLKLANSEADAESLELENRVLCELQNTPVGNIIPAVLPSLNGNLMEVLATKEGEYRARLVEFVDGRVLAKVVPQSEELLLDLGRKLGIFTRSIREIRHTVAVTGLGKDFHWNLDRFEQTVEQFKEDLSEQEILAPFLERHKTRVLPIRDDLRKSLIHNDANDHNIIVSESTEWPPQTTGLIDFGDMVFGSTVNELAIAIAYVMLSKSDPLNSASFVVRGFHQEFPLTDQEFTVLFDLACARLCTSVVMAAHQRKLNPENEYLSVTDQPARRALKRANDIHSDFAAAYFRSACELPPIIDASLLDQWFTDHSNDFFPLLGRSFRESDIHVFDLSVSSLDPLAGDLGSHSADQISSLLNREEKVGLGRYREPRICYVGDQFLDPENSDGEDNEARTIHMGIDLFADPATPIHAPLDGTVHSFADNNIPFDYGPTIILQHATPEGIPFFTLYGHLSRESLAGLETGQRIEKGNSFAAVGSQAENGGWAPHLHFQIMSHDLGLYGNFPGVVKASELELWKSIILNPYALAGIPINAVLPLSTETEEIETDRQRSLNPSLSLSYEKPLHMVRGRQQFLYDINGHQYLDCVNNVCHVGHCNPRVVQAACEQLGLLNTNTRYLHENITRYAKALTQTLPNRLNTCFFVNSGSEANDLAIRLARTFTGRSEIICVEGAYHGNLTSLVDISPYKYNSRGGKGKPPGTHEIPLPDSYRGIHRSESTLPKCIGTYYADFIEKAVAKSANSHTNQSGQQIAAFICESILSCGGQIVLPDRFLERAYEICRSHKILCIADEVQVGFGRVGEQFWGFELQGVEPDIVTLGKPIGNGFPLGAVVTTREIAEAFNNGMEYFNTYGGNPVACNVGLAVLDVIETEQLQPQALSVGNHLIDGLRQLQAQHPCIGDVRGKGLFIGVEFVQSPNSLVPNARLARYVVERMKRKKILLSTDGPDENVIKIKPPICFDENDATRLLASLDAVLKEDFPTSFQQGCTRN